LKTKAKSNKAGVASHWCHQ